MANMRGNTTGQLESLLTAVKSFIQRSDDLKDGEAYPSSRFEDARLVHFLYADADLRGAVQETEEFLK